MTENKTDRAALIARWKALADRLSKSADRAKESFDPSFWNPWNEAAAALREAADLLASQAKAEPVAFFGLSAIRNSRGVFFKEADAREVAGADGVFEPLFASSAGSESAESTKTPTLTDRDALGRIVRVAWIKWAKSQASPKLSWLVPYDALPESDKEADRQIGEAVAKVAEPLLYQELHVLLGICEERKARLHRSESVEAIETAAKAVALLDYMDEEGHASWDETPGDARQWYRRLARAALASTAGRSPNEKEKMGK